jgi:ATP-dependent exoDNAse (exonuclease V) alpha subunit
LDLSTFAEPRERAAAQHFLSTDIYFDTLPAVAVGCKVILQRNLSVQKRLVNGSIGAVQYIQLNEQRQPTRIGILFQGHQRTTEVLRCSTRSELLGGGAVYHKHTFPLALAFAMTGHKAQGATLRHRTILDIADAFCLALAYTMVTRVTRRSLLSIIGALNPAMFTPTPFAQWLTPEGLAAYQAL